ncbi:hypothetical protein J2W91_000023 [Paenibacillus amylolyticus]|uniref:Uncharacterized protein n=1 Tax=Paenibacillus amylolyticus TaxID=1451 RepID=A0AAP5GW07_PAEAM|nr:hypothetical protein [Paenibacillus amylolyticus]
MNLLTLPSVDVVDEPVRNVKKLSIRLDFLNLYSLSLTEGKM